LLNRISLFALLPGVHRRVNRRSSGPALYLTFDDGPHPTVTPKVLDMLERYAARATFFVIGERALKYKSVAADIVARGHRLGNHSFYHRRFDSLPVKQQLDEIRRTDDVLTEIDPGRPHAFRPPNGRASIALLLRLHSEGFNTVLWSVDSKDYAHDNVRSIEILRQHSAKSGDIVLLHDDHEAVLEVLDASLPRWASSRFIHPTIDSQIV